MRFLGDFSLQKSAHQGGVTVCFFVIIFIIFQLGDFIQWIINGDIGANGSFYSHPSLVLDFWEKKKPRTRGSTQEGGHHLSFEMDDSSIGRKFISKLLNNVKETSLVVSSNVNRKRAFLLKTQIVLIIEMPREENFSLQKPRTRGITAFKLSPMAWRQ